VTDRVPLLRLPRHWMSSPDHLRLDAGPLRLRPTLLIVLGDANVNMREAENLAHAFGKVFPPLPADLFKRPPRGWAGSRGVSAVVLAFRRRQLHGAAKNAVLLVAAGGFATLSDGFLWKPSGVPMIPPPRPKLASGELGRGGGIRTPDP
jgi:hypothetical protein